MMTKARNCRFCSKALIHTFVDLGMSPLSNSFLKSEQLHQNEPLFPLHAYVCDSCFLVQLEQLETPENIFGDYAYFSSYSESWLEHARTYTDMAINQFGLSERSLVVELASNDGYLLKNFLAKGIPVLGIDPAANVAKAAEERGIRTLIRFFGESLAKELYCRGMKADLIIGNNVLAHVPDLKDFVAGMKILLRPGGTITLEFPHLLRLMTGNQFDTIYHEHFSYFSLISVQQVLAAQDLTIFDVEELTTHGGSLRIFVKHSYDPSRPVESRVTRLKEREERFGLARLETYAVFDEGVKSTKRKFLDFLLNVKEQGQNVAGYGAPAKGNTLLNYCGVGTDLLPYTVDRNPHKQGLFLPGSHIPVRDPEMIRKSKPDYLLILPWNLRDEIVAQHSYIREWGGRFVVPIPRVEVIP